MINLELTVKPASGHLSGPHWLESTWTRFSSPQQILTHPIFPRRPKMKRFKRTRYLTPNDCTWSILGPSLLWESNTGGTLCSSYPRSFGRPVPVFPNLTIQECGPRTTRTHTLDKMGKTTKYACSQLLEGLIHESMTRCVRTRVQFTGPGSDTAKISK